MRQVKFGLSLPGLRYPLASTVQGSVGIEPSHRHEPLHDYHDAADRHEIEPHHLVGVLVADLDRDLRSVPAMCDVRLSERRARDRLLVKSAKVSSCSLLSSLLMRSSMSEKGRRGI